MKRKLDQNESRILIPELTALGFLDNEPSVALGNKQNLRLDIKISELMDTITYIKNFHRSFYEEAIKNIKL